MENWLLRRVAKNARYNAEILLSIHLDDSLMMKLPKGSVANLENLCRFEVFQGYSIKIYL